MPTSLLLLLACAPDKLDDPGKKSGTHDSDPQHDSSAAGVGELWTESSHLELGTHCGASETSLTIGNRGDGPLEIADIHVEGEGWTLDPVSLPLLLDPGQETSLGLTSEGGEATLWVGDEAVLLSSSPDLPPVLEILSAPGDVDVASEVDLEARVQDAEDGAEGLTVQWSSDVDGALGSAVSDGKGVASLSWSSAAQSVGAHDLTASVTDSCGNTTSLPLALCQEGGTSLASTGSTGVEFSGHASWDATAETIRLTDLEKYRTGSAFQKGHVVAADDVTLLFDFYVGDGTGADGLAVVALDTSHSGALLGAEGCGLGYGTPSAGCIDGSNGLPGWALEFDTYYNEQIDASEADHVALSIDGDQETTLFYVEVAELEDTGWHSVTLRVREGRFTVTLDGAVIVDQTVDADLDYPAWIGFTAASGGDTNRHVVDNLVVQDNVCL
jgi:hypothetical protein